jgi:hypothetical protein
MHQPATPRFIARKLLAFFACPEPPEPVVAEAAALLTRTRLDIKWFLRGLFESRFFFSSACRRTRISSPVEYVIGTCRTLGLRLPANELVSHLTEMGQELFAPPNVKGWDGEQKWIHASAWAARVAFAEKVVEDAASAAFGPRLRIDRFLPADEANAGAVVSLLAEQFLDGQVSAEARADLIKSLLTGEQGSQEEQFRSDADFRRQQVRTLLGTLLSLPEYHVC